MDWLLFLFIAVSLIMFVTILVLDRHLTQVAVIKARRESRRVRLYLSLAGVVWFLCTLFCSIVYTAQQVHPSGDIDAVLTLRVGLLVHVLVIGLLVSRSMVLTDRAKRHAHS